MAVILTLMIIIWALWTVGKNVDLEVPIDVSLFDSYYSSKQEDQHYAGRGIRNDEGFGVSGINTETDSTVVDGKASRDRRTQGLQKRA